MFKQNKNDIMMIYLIIETRMISWIVSGMSRRNIQHAEDVSHSLPQRMDTQGS